jgi:hypothetical protein
MASRTCCPKPAGARSDASGETRRRSSQVEPSAPIWLSRLKAEMMRTLADLQARVSMNNADNQTAKELALMELQNADVSTDTNP